MTNNEPNQRPADMNDNQQQRQPEAATKGNESIAGEPSIESLQAELADARDKALRAHAELENVRRRARRELEDELRYANMPLMRDLLPVVDNVRRAVEAAEKSNDAAGLLEGFKLVAKQLEEVLARHHCTPIEALHEPFDPNLHEAILQQPTDEFPPGTVVAVAQPGYQLRDRVVRPTQVIVSSAKAEEAETEAGGGTKDA